LWLGTSRMASRAKHGTCQPGGSRAGRHGPTRAADDTPCVSRVQDHANSTCRERQGNGCSPAGSSRRQQSLAAVACSSCWQQPSHLLELPSLPAIAKASRKVSLSPCMCLYTQSVVRVEQPQVSQCLQQASTGGHRDLCCSCSSAVVQALNSMGSFLMGTKRAAALQPVLKKHQES